MNNDLISRSAAIEAIKSYCKDCDNYNGVRCGACGFDYAMNAVDSVLAADAEQVVRCKDCVLHGKCITEETFEACGKYDGFCCAGKRRDDDARNTPNHA